MSTQADDVKELAASVVSGDTKIDLLLEDLQGTSRRKRQIAAAAIAEVAKEDIELVNPIAGEIVEALDVPEAQTRWELLDTLTEICSQDAKVCEKALGDAETGLFDEDSGPLRLAECVFYAVLDPLPPADLIKSGA